MTICNVSPRTRARGRAWGGGSRGVWGVQRTMLDLRRQKQIEAKFCSQGLGEVKLVCTKNTKWVLSGPHICVLEMENSIKEAINLMKPKQIFNSLLAVLFLFPLMGTSAQQAANSGSIEVNGISSQGFICGRYADASGIAHGFLARVRGTPPATPAGTEMKANVSRSPVTPLTPSPSAWGGATSAR